MVTNGLASLGLERVNRVFKAVAAFDSFNPTTIPGVSTTRQPGSRQRSHHLEDRLLRPQQTDPFA